jgi:hypothetical protein
MFKVGIGAGKLNLCVCVCVCVISSFQKLERKVRENAYVDREFPLRSSCSRCDIGMF